MDQLLAEIKRCTICEAGLPHAPRPIVTGSKDARLVIIGQAPGRRVHKSGVPWDDPSGDQLRRWLAIDKETFYDVTKIALVPMGFCYPGKGSSGDLPPRTECAPAWHEKVLSEMSRVDLTLLVGQYAQRYYLGNAVKSNLTATVSAFKEYLPAFLPTPHPSPRNRIWLKKNPWFEEEVIPILQARIRALIVA